MPLSIIPLHQKRGPGSEAWSQVSLGLAQDVVRCSIKNKRFQSDQPWVQQLLPIHGYIFPNHLLQLQHNVVLSDNTIPCSSKHDGWWESHCTNHFRSASPPHHGCSRDSHLESRSTSSCMHGNIMTKWWFQHGPQGTLVTMVNYSHYEPIVGIWIIIMFVLFRPQLRPTSKSQNFEATEWTGPWATHLFLPFPFPPRRTWCSVSGSAPAFALALALAFDEATEAFGKAFAFGKGIDFALDSIVEENWDLAPGFSWICVISQGIKDQWQWESLLCS